MEEKISKSRVWVNLRKKKQDVAYFNFLTNKAFVICSEVNKFAAEDVFYSGKWFERNLKAHHPDANKPPVQNQS